MLGVLLPASLLDLLFPGYLDLLLQSMTSALLLLEQLKSLLFSLFDLLVQDLILLVAHRLQYLCLSLDELLSFGLLLSPIIAGAAMSLSSVSVISNALRLRNMKL